MWDNAFGWVRVWVRTMRWEKRSTFNKPRGGVSCQAAYPFFLQNSVLVGLWFSIFPSVNSQPVFIKPNNRNSTRAGWCFFSPRQIGACHPAVTTSASFSSRFPESSEHYRNKETLLLLKAMHICFSVLPLWEAAFLDSCWLQNGEPVPVKKSLSRCCNFQPLAQLHPNRLYWSYRCTFSNYINVYFHIATVEYSLEWLLLFTNHQNQFKQSTLKLPWFL